MKIAIKCLVSLPLYCLAAYGATSFLQDLSMVSEKAFLEKIFLALFIAIGLIITEQVLALKKQNYPSSY